MNTNDIQIGSRWQDLDPRSPNRTVKVTAIMQAREDGKMMVEYKANGRVCLSEHGRFLKAFKLIV